MKQELPTVQHNSSRKTDLGGVFARVEKQVTSITLENAVRRQLKQQNFAATMKSR
jgi:hypothetical protein